MPDTTSRQSWAKRSERAGLFEAGAAQVAEVEAAVAIRAHRQQLRIEGGEIALPVDAEDAEGAIEFVLVEALLALDQPDHLLEFPQPQRVAIGFAEPPELLQKGSVLPFPLAALHRAAGVHTLPLFHVEAHRR
jgi:hypothetical protein